MDPAEREEREETDLDVEPMLLDVGPAHPATHGTVRIVVELDGETILRADTQIG